MEQSWPSCNRNVISWSGICYGAKKCRLAPIYSRRYNDCVRKILNFEISNFILVYFVGNYKFALFADSNIWSSTLAGDLAQSALLKRKGQTYVGPDGYFNNTLCPTEFMLRISNQGIRYH